MDSSIHIAHHLQAILDDVDLPAHGALRVVDLSITGGIYRISELLPVVRFVRAIRRVARLERSVVALKHKLKEAFVDQLRNAAHQNLERAEIVIVSGAQTFSIESIDDFEGRLEAGNEAVRIA